jgi:Uri superfamily endonuclease
VVLRGAYCLCVSVEEEVGVEVGALGMLSFAPGRYVYVGSALNGLVARVLRHVNTSLGEHKAIHWHIDYLLKERGVHIESVYVRVTDRKIECELARAVSGRGKPVKGFGCSDCRCVSHLFKVDCCGFLSDFGLERRLISHFEKN